MRIATGLLLVLAANASAAPDTPPQVGKLPAHYAKLFVEGAVFTYDAKVVTWDYVWLETHDKKPWKKATEKLPPPTCKVVKVATFAAAIASQVTCDGHPFGEGKQFKFPVPGIYVATQRGLMQAQMSEFPTDEASLTDAVLLIAKRPKAAKKVQRTADDPMAYTLTTGVRREGSAWCVYSGTRGAPHDGESTVCYGGGITSGRNDVGGELHDATFRAR